MKSRTHYLLLFFLLLIRTTSSQSIIKTLPGYPGPLPFKLETGYISVGENDERQLFYYFIESERDPGTDPLVFWLTGGPGCSGISSLVIEIGPLAFDLESFDGSFPSLKLNPYSWTKVATIIFIDAPVGTGFSYSTTLDGYRTSDTNSTDDNYLFLRKWLLKHPKFIKNWLYVAGDSYGGKIVPMVALEIAKGNEAGLQPRMLLQGYIVGNPMTDEKKDVNERIPYAHRMALISDEYFELAKSACHGEYVNPDPNNYKCLYALRPANEGTKTSWTRCNKTLAYEEDVEGVFRHHQLLNEKGFQALAYSGDHDMIVPYMSTIKWIRNLNLTVEEEWRPWNVNGQIAGYTMQYKNNQAYITFATVKGAGHTAPEYKPIECLAMIDRWFSLFPL